MVKENRISQSEQKILDAARQVFMKNGLEKTKMQDIADTAGISRTALNYYFRTKENLFQRLVDQLFDTIVPAIEDVVMSDIPIMEKITSFVDIYETQLQNNDFIPSFVIVEVQRNPKSIFDFINKSSRIQAYIKMMGNTVKKEMKAGNIRTVTIEEIITTYFGLIFTPYLLNPLIEEFLDKDPQKKQDFFHAHKENTKILLSEFFKPDRS